ncbi:MAG: DUF2934 domain-containing protein [Acidobacteriaceae bacterium]
MTIKSAEANGTAKRRKPAAKKQTTVATAISAEPTRQEIARLAEKYWMERGQPDGSPELDWLRAEQELRTAS